MSKKIFITLILIYFLLSFIAFFIDVVFNLDQIIYLKLFKYEFYDFPYLNFLGTISTFFATAIAFYAIYESGKNLEKQLNIEQTPFVVAYGQLNKGEVKLKIKNIGRGAASNIRVSYIPPRIENNQYVYVESPMFKDNQPHTQDLSMNERIEDWEIWPAGFVRVDEYRNKDYPQTIFIYIKYLDQLKNEYITRVQFEIKYPDNLTHVDNEGFSGPIKVMQNEVLVPK